jgi:hypothetical protein
MPAETSERRLQQPDAVMGEPPRLRLEAIILGTYREMPGLSLHLGQAMRLFGVRRATCQIVFDDLVTRGVLRQATDGQYVRREVNR